MPKKETIQVQLAAPNPNLSPATRFGNLVFVAGQTGRHPTTGEVGRDVREQTRNVLERIKLILEAAGTSMENVLTVTTHLTKREDLAAYNTHSAPLFRGSPPFFAVLQSPMKVKRRGTGPSPVVQMRWLS